MELAFEKGDIVYTNKVVIVVEGDPNDGDYITETSVLRVKDFNEIYPYIHKLSPKTTVRKVYNDDDSIPEDIKDSFEELIDVPCGEYGCDRIRYKSITYYDENGVGYKVN